MITMNIYFGIIMHSFCFVDSFFLGGVAFCALRFVALLWEFGGQNHGSIKAGIFNFFCVRSLTFYEKNTDHEVKTTARI